MIVALAGLSLLVGMVCPFVGSVAFVIYFSIAAATTIAVLAVFFGSGAGIIFLAWLATIAAIQVGFAFSVMILAMLKLKTTDAWYFEVYPQQERPSVEKRHVAEAFDRAQPTSVNHGGALDA